MKKLHIIMGFVASLAINLPTAKAANCANVGDNSINDAMVSSLQQQAANAEARAATARNPGERARWEATARTLEMQAEAAQSRQATLSSAARSVCDQILNKNDDDDDDN